MMERVRAAGPTSWLHRCSARKRHRRPSKAAGVKRQGRESERKALSTAGQGGGAPMRKSALQVNDRQGPRPRLHSGWKQGGGLDAGIASRALLRRASWHQPQQLMEVPLTPAAFGVSARKRKRLRLLEMPGCWAGQKGCSIAGLLSRCVEPAGELEKSNRSLTPPLLPFQLRRCCAQEASRLGFAGRCGSIDLLADPIAYEAPYDSNKAGGTAFSPWSQTILLIWVAHDCQSPLLGGIRLLSCFKGPAGSCKFCWRGRSGTHCRIRFGLFGCWARVRGPAAVSRLTSSRGFSGWCVIGLAVGPGALAFISKNGVETWLRRAKGQGGL